MKEESGIVLAKGEGISLQKDAGLDLSKGEVYSGDLVLNLNWSQGVRGDIDLDLGCLYELKDGTKGAVQAIGNLFGSLDNPPYIQLDGDDRSGANADGETMRFSMSNIDKVKRVLIFAYIYSGTPDWASAKPVVTLTCPGHKDIVVNVDEYGTTERACAIALLENHKDVTFKVKKVVRFFPGHQSMDRGFDWGMTWRTTYKDN